MRANVEKSSSAKVVVGLGVAIGSFCATTPPFWLNLVTIFASSISLGMNVTLYSLESGGVWHVPHLERGDSWLEHVNGMIVVSLAFLVGQLVGSSGGTMFLAEFIVTSVSLLLGGTGTISASAIESWGCFLFLSFSAFWGYLFGRVGLLDAVRQRKTCHSTRLLVGSLVTVVLFWCLLLCFARWDTPATLMIVEPHVRQMSASDLLMRLQ